MAHVDRKEAMKIFLLLFVLTVLEVGVVYIPGISAGMLITLLVVMAFAKAGIVGMYYMHLKYDTEMLQLTVMIPMMIPALYALVLVVEAASRMVF
jgi:caa(3)-type oxidase subunit IV